MNGMCDKSENKKEIAISREANDFIIDQPIAVIQSFQALTHRLAAEGRLAGQVHSRVEWLCQENPEDTVAGDSQGEGNHEEVWTMTKAQEKECVANAARLDEIVRLAEEASPRLRRRGERTARTLADRQNRAFARIRANPKSQAYRDYIETPAQYGV